MKSMKSVRHFVMPILAVISLILLVVAILTPWLIRSTHLMDQPTSKFKVTLWSETARRKFNGTTKARVSKHTVRCEEKRLDTYDDDTCEKLISSQYLVVLAAVFLGLSIATSFGFTWMAIEKGTIGWFRAAKAIPCALILLSVCLIIGAIAQWPDILDFYEGIEDKSRIDYNVGGVNVPMPNELLRSQNTSLSTGFSCSTGSSVIAFIAAVIGACILPSESQQQPSTPQIVYVASVATVAEATKKI